MNILDSLVIKYISAIGAGYGTIKTGTGIAEMSQRKALTWKSLVPVVMSGVIGVYGLVVAYLITSQINSTDYSLFKYVFILELK